MPARMPDRPLQRAKAKAGGLSALARALGVTPPAVAQWSRIPVRHVLAVERVTGIRREELRPDFYPPVRRKRRNNT
jgi:DNA-binding transcriptional regulator YdaS (Cro superfamily)